MSQEYNDSDSWQATEFRIGVPLVGAMLLIVMRLAEEIFSKSSWTIGRGFNVVLVLIFLVVLPLSWREIRKMFKAFDRIFSEKGADSIPPDITRKLRRLIKYLISLNASIILALIMVFLALRKF